MMQPLTAFTSEQIIALAPDPASIKAGQEQAFPRRWKSLGCNQEAAWGLCQGSARGPYQTQIDLSGPAFRCSCPSKKYPCKHALGLFLLLASYPQEFTSVEIPTWVEEWRLASAKRKEPARLTVEPQPPADPQAQSKRAAQREARVHAGVDDLALWLKDMVRGGLAALQSRPVRDFETAAARLVDAQAPGLARRVRSLAAAVASGDGWQDSLLERLGALYLLTLALERQDALPADLQAEVRGQAGWQQSKEALLEQPGVRDAWLSLGQRILEEPLPSGGPNATLTTRTTWLWGERCRRSAVLLDFAAFGQPLEAGLLPGAVHDAELVFYPGAGPLRALVRAGFDAPAPIQTMSGYASFSELLTAYSMQLAANPWCGPLPAPLLQVQVYPAQDGWRLRDRFGGCLPIDLRFQHGWQLMGIGGGHAIDVFGEWLGEAFWPISCFAGGAWTALG